MPRTLNIAPELCALIAAQDGLATSAQTERYGFTADAVQHRVARRQWSRLLPGVVLTCAGSPSRRQLLVAAHLWAGGSSVIDAADACAWYGVTPGWFESTRVHVVVPVTSTIRSRAFVVVRRTVGEIAIGESGRVPYVAPSTAVVAAARRAPSDSAAIAFVSLALQRQLVTVDELLTAREAFGDKWCRRVDSALVAVGVGLRSPAEKQAADLFARSGLLPAPRWNVWLDLGDGGPAVCVDALWEDAGLVAEINGREYHAWAERYEDMHRRGTRLTAAGLAVMNCTPRQLRQYGAETLGQLERMYARQPRRGLPSAVRVIDPPAIAA